MLLSILKLVPIRAWQTLLSHLLDGCATGWISVNGLNQDLLSGTQWQASGIDKLTKDDWYLVICNHQSWVDIVVLQRVLNHRIPFLKFFLKQQLIWVPLLGLAWWALDFPFMRRSSKTEIAKNPTLKGKDLETTRKACQKFKYKPVSVMNFVEGTRWTPEKYARQKPRFKHLLKPKAGGLAFVLGAMGDQLTTLLNVTIYYPDGVPTFWDFACGKVKRVQINAEAIPIAEIIQNGHFSEHYQDDPKERVKFQSWLNDLWLQKDETITALIKQNEIKRAGSD
jgi:1-acyl-sn-glycerol-3-phosphate acyltransferase